jgi:hypothetical protein
MQQIIAKNTKIFFTSWHLGFNSAIMCRYEANVLYEKAKELLERRILTTKSSEKSLVDEILNIIKHIEEINLLFA